MLYHTKNTKSIHLKNADYAQQFWACGAECFDDKAENKTTNLNCYEVWPKLSLHLIESYYTLEGK